MTPEERLAGIQARYADLANAESLRRARFELVARDVPDLVAFAEAVLALCETNGHDYDHVEACGWGLPDEGSDECPACWAADIRRLADQHLGGGR